MSRLPCGLTPLGLSKVQREVRRYGLRQKPYLGPYLFPLTFLLHFGKAQRSLLRTPCRLKKGDILNAVVIYIIGAVILSPF